VSTLHNKNALCQRGAEMSKREKEDRGGKEAGMKKDKSAEDLGRELLRAAKEGDVERVKERGCALSRGEGLVGCSHNGACCGV
jgi:hypothetical protein